MFIILKVCNVNNVSTSCQCMQKHRMSMRRIKIFQKRLYFLKNTHKMSAFIQQILVKYNF